MIERSRVRIPAGAAGEFSSPGSTLCADSYSVSVSPPLLPQWHVKDPGHSVKNAGGRLHLNTPTPLTHRNRSGLTMPLSRQSVGMYQETSSHTTHLGTHCHSCLSSLSHYRLIRVELVCVSLSPLLKKIRRRKAQVGNELSNILPISSDMRKKPPWYTCGAELPSPTRVWHVLVFT